MRLAEAELDPMLKAIFLNRNDAMFASVGSPRRKMDKIAFIPVGSYYSRTVNAAARLEWRSNETITRGIPARLLTLPIFTSWRRRIPQCQVW